ncbi:MAG: gfo/Idh/MocA family oxidoreductase [Chitinivibrionales bacterium]|nr:gfo/Idh/MocA family oxidoreductase [Chitinivibrionales bacterium]MBD3395795.1 gfo/Idh/MocA family oxidoreductase [Chitinivibrionales bacterium]
MSRSSVHIGVIGAGGRGALAHYAHDPENGVRLVAGADILDIALKRFRDRFGPDTFTTHDYRELLAREDVDTVFVTSPDYLHEEHAVAALEAKKAVYIEKPMATTIHGCDRILRAARENGQKLYVGHNMRHMDFVLKMKDVIDRGMIGEVKAGWCRHFIGYGGDAYFKDWHAERAKSTGLLLQKGSHDIDILHWLCGGCTARVNALGGLTLYDRITDRHASSERGDTTWRLENWPPLSQKGLNPVIDVEDISLVNLALDNGVFASYEQCHFTPDAWRNYTIIGTEGRVENFGDAPGRCSVRVWNTRSEFKENGDIAWEIPRAKGSHGGADPRIVQEFVEYVRNGGPVKTSPIAARNSVAAGYLATMSLRQGGIPFSVPPVDPELAMYFSGQS